MTFKELFPSLKDKNVTVEITHNLTGITAQVPMCFQSEDILRCCVDKQRLKEILHLNNVSIDDKGIWRGEFLITNRHKKELGL